MKFVLISFSVYDFWTIKLPMMGVYLLLTKCWLKLLMNEKASAGVWRQIDRFHNNHLVFLFCLVVHWCVERRRLQWWSEFMGHCYCHVLERRGIWSTHVRLSGCIDRSAIRVKQPDSMVRAVLANIYKFQWSFQGRRFRQFSDEQYCKTGGSWSLCFYPAVACSGVKDIVFRFEWL